MRLILTILLIGLFKADAQMVINASAPYKPLLRGLLLDDYPNAQGAYSLRKLRNGYTGSAIRVRKDTTGQPEQDIGFLSSGELDTISLKSFLNARSGFIVRWYDQTTAGNNIEQGTQSHQPRIALIGVIERKNSKPSIFINTTSSRLEAATDFFKNVSNGFTFSVSSRSENNSNEATIFQIRTGTLASRVIVSYRISAAGNQGLGAGGRRLDANSFQAVGTNAYNGNLLLASTHFNWGSAILSIFENGNASGTLNPFQTAGNTSNTGGNIIVGSSGATSLNGYISEIILYSSDQSSNRTSIESNINTFYAIY